LIGFWYLQAVQGGKDQTVVHALLKKISDGHWMLLWEALEPWVRFMNREKLVFLKSYSGLGMTVKGSSYS
jgi:hypothetical protein